MKIKLVLLLAAVFGSLPLAADDRDTREMEEVVVVGTRIDRQDYVSPSPVYTIDREELLQDGTPTLTEYLNQSPQFAPAYDKTSNFDGSGRGEANLRGLGPNRTLVMIDGQRLGPAGNNSTVDLNTLPVAIIESVETLTGGASAVYGSDAVSGVVNIRLRRNFDGLEVSAGYDVTDEDDGDVRNLSLLWGTDFAAGAGNISAYYVRTERDELRTNARDYTAQPIGEDGQGNLRPDGSPITPSGSIPAPVLVDGVIARSGLIFNPDGTIRSFQDPADAYNYYAEFNYLQIGMERDSAGIFTAYEFSDTLTGRLDLMASNRVISFEAAPDPIGYPAASINLDNPFLSAQASAVLADNFDPQGTGFFTGPFLYRPSQLGGRESEDELKDIRLRLALEGDINDNWSWSANYIWYDFEREDVQSNYVNLSRFLQSLLADPATGQCFDTSNGCVPGNYFGAGNLSPEAADFIRAPLRIGENETKQQILQLTVNGSVDLFEREISLALGAERREEESYRSGRSGGFSFPEQGGEINLNELFVETLIPVVSGLTLAEEINLEAGYRYSDYDTVGSFSTWKAGFTWRLTDTLMLRGMRQKAIRVPNIAEYFVEDDRSEYIAASFGGSIDRCSASQDPVGTGIADVCIAQGLAADQVGIFEANPFFLSYNVSGPNPNLSEEEADTRTFGLSWEPHIESFAIEGISVALDYYEVEIDNAVRSMFRDDILSNCYAVNDPAHEFCTSITRDGSGNIAEVRVGNVNAALFTSKGVDLQLDAMFAVPGLGANDADLSLSLIASKITERDSQAAPAALRFKCAGRFGFPCSTDATPEYNIRLNAGYRSGPFSLGATWRWLDGMDNAVTISGEPWLPFYTPAVPGTGSESYIDLHFSWEINDHLDLRMRVANLRDTEPPILGFGAQQSNTIPNFYDVLGRRYHLGLTYRL